MATREKWEPIEMGIAYNLAGNEIPAVWHVCGDEVTIVDGENDIIFRGTKEGLKKLVEEL